MAAMSTDPKRGEKIAIVLDALESIITHQPNDPVDQELQIAAISLRAASEMIPPSPVASSPTDG